MLINVNEGIASVTGPFPPRFIETVAKLTGKKQWVGPGEMTFEANAGNIRLMEDMYPKARWNDPGGTVDDVKRLRSLAVAATDAIYQHPSTRPDETIPIRYLKRGIPKIIPQVISEYVPRVKPWKHQDDCFRISCERPEYAVLWEMGTGKSALILRTAGHLHLNNKLSGLVIVAPKGVQEQWVEEQIPEHMMKGLKLNCMIWEKGIFDRVKLDTTFSKSNGLSVLAIHIDALRIKVNKSGRVLSRSPGVEDVERFLKAHRGRVMMVVDESHLIKGHESQRTEACIQLGKLATYRRICTGTPIARDLVDMWSQFNFLNPNILGQPYFTAFRSEYCILGGYSGHEIIAHKNVEQFYSLIAPHSYRTTKKECLDLPEKQFVITQFDLSDDEMRHYQTMKHEFMAMLDDGEIVDVESALVQLLRLQQIACGFLPRSDGTLYHTSTCARMDALLNIERQINGPSVIWSRFTENIESVAENLEKHLGRKVAMYYGEQNAKMNAAAKRDFISGKVDDLSVNPQSGGTGLDGLQKVCQHAIYYSNSFRLLDRLQSEDRTHRSGMGESMTYFDLQARKTVDRLIISNHRRKKDLADLTLDKIRMALAA